MALRMKESSGNRSYTRGEAATPRGSQSRMSSGSASAPHSRRGWILPTSMRTVSRSDDFQTCGAERVVAALASKGNIPQHHALPTGGYNRRILSSQPLVGDPQAREPKQEVLQE